MNIVDRYPQGKKVTFWYKRNDNGTEFEFHHIDTSGWADTDFPMPIKPEFVNQRSWASYIWEKRYELKI
ncbi:hypothetical protein A8L34_05020 [Bacillus sp. FJAT-27264]|nr:hypothetical protein A8L34_05020 [Bacillus sp. FJAT-27264]